MIKSTLRRSIRRAQVHNLIARDVVETEVKEATCRSCRSQLGLDDSDEANGRLQALFVISITLGLRPGELRMLTWDHVDPGSG